MTREDAIEVLKLVDENVSCDDCLYYAQMEDCPTDEDCIIVQAVDMAIKALSQEPCDDAISREWLMRKATERFYTTNYFNHISAMIEEAPSVTQKSGMWIEHPEIETSTPEYLMFYECSECGDKQCFYKSDIHKKHFCNNCGAKMESEE